MQATLLCYFVNNLFFSSNCICAQKCELVDKVHIIAPLNFITTPKGVWADPGGRCNTGPPRGRRRASPHDPPGPKNLIISKSPIGLVSEIKLIRTDTIILS